MSHIADNTSPGNGQDILVSYETLVQSARHRTSGIPGRTLEEEADSDRGRVLFSSSFRRLQDKAQVFSLERNAAIRSRLTHSMEVASIGRFIAQQVFKTVFNPQNTQSTPWEKERAFITFVEAACFLHDIGNPPFGHFGENAISAWFIQHTNKLAPDVPQEPALSIWQQHYKDFCHFDGNPQGFRVVSRLHVKEEKDLNGMNLTATTLASTLKYPWANDNIGRRHLGSEIKKMGYYQTEADVVDWIRSTLGLGLQQRHPFVYLMEAADDIAYCLSDIEDGIEKRLFTAREMAHELRRAMDTVGQQSPNATKDLANICEGLRKLEALDGDSTSTSVAFLSGIEDFHSGVIRYLVRAAASSYTHSHAEILAGTAPSLLKSQNAASLLDPLRAFAEKRLYLSSVVRDRELTANAVLTGLLEKYDPVMSCARKRFEAALAGELQDSAGHRITGELALLSRLPQRFKAVYLEAVKRSDQEYQKESPIAECLERIHRIHLVVDYIAGMTDDYALQTYRLVSGIQTLSN